MNVLDKIYYNDKTKVGLYERNEPTMPFIITIGKRIVCTCDRFADAYRFYNETIMDVIQGGGLYA